MYHIIVAGITTGWGVYFGLIQAMIADRPVFLFDFESIKLFSLCFDLPSPTSYSSCVKDILDLHRVTKVNVVGHSFGTITATWFVNHFPEYVSHLTLIDPVSLLLAHPEVAYNFLYRPPSTFIEWMIYYGASQEITIANCLRRNFWWYNNVLWLEDIPASIGVHVSLAGADQISRTSSIEEYIKTCSEGRRLKNEEIRKGNNESTASETHGSTTTNTSSPVAAEIKYSVRDGHSHAQILVCRNSLLELAHLVHQEYKELC
jgi:pimeloyl-ACP methyl ester carboxylesterase